jgi:hypothetical protein
MDPENSVGKSLGKNPLVKCRRIWFLGEQIVEVESR